jgi:sialic acid synthase
MGVELTIDGCQISDECDAYLIAEIGHNHQGSLEKAMELFKSAKECGVNAVKLQKRHNRTLYTRELYGAPYDSENSFGATYGEHREALEFGRHEYVELQRYAASLGLTMFATAFDIESADFLANLDMPAYKIASGDLTNTPLLRHVAAIGKPMIVSTGGANLEDVQRAYDTIMAINPRLCLLQCTASYPAEPDVMNLRAISTFRTRFPNIVVGLSDHQNGIALSPVAYVLGARVIEKHFTLSRAMKGTDHAFSVEPAGMRKLVRDLRRTKVALGDGIKRAYPCEAKPLYKMAKKLTAARTLPAGHVLTPKDFACQSPGDGLNPSHLDNLVGLELARPMECGEAFTFDHVKAS